MSPRRSFRRERARAAQALLGYLGNPCASTERALIDATHDLEAAARRGRRGASRPRWLQLERWIAG
ncbi:MAG TPA: hypothetical protein VFO64_09855 [Gaiellaceae bacterium]|nr:hypothetical protein [Gaiellaceae bacterium]